MRRSSSRWLLALAGAFLLAWLIGFVSSLAAARCLKQTIASADRLRACRIASATTFSRFGTADEPEFARIAFERAIVLVETGQTGEGEAAMRDLFGRTGLDAAALAAPPGSVTGSVTVPANIAILERARRLDPDSDAFAAFARALEAP